MTCNWKAPAPGIPLALASLLIAEVASAQKIENVNHLRLTVGENYESIEGDPTLFDKIESRETFYSANIGTLLTQKTSLSTWNNSLELESGHSFKGKTDFQQATFGSSYTQNTVRDSISLAIGGSLNRGDLNYRRPLLTQNQVAPEIKATDSEYYSLQLGYSYAFSPFTRVFLESQSSYFDQDAGDVTIHRLSPRWQYLVTAFWDTGIFLAATQQSIEDNPIVTRSLESGWTNTFRPSVQDVIVQSIGLIRTYNDQTRTSDYTMGLSYVHLFSNNELFQSEAESKAADFKKETDPASTSTQASDTTGQEKLLMEKLRQTNLKNLITLFWLRKLSGTEDGSRQLITEQYGTAYDYSHSQGHDIQVSVSQSQQYDPVTTTQIQRMDRVARAAYTHSFRSLSYGSNASLDRVSLEAQYQWTNEKTLQVIGRQWVILLGSETRF